MYTAVLLHAIYWKLTVKVSQLGLQQKDGFIKIRSVTGTENNNKNSDVSDPHTSSQTHYYPSTHKWPQHTLWGAVESVEAVEAPGPEGQEVESQLQPGYGREELVGGFSPPLLLLLVVWVVWVVWVVVVMVSEPFIWLHLFFCCHSLGGWVCEWINLGDKLRLGVV